MQQEQNTISLALGIISYLRCLFSEESFENKRIGDFELKILKNTTETTRMIGWINSLNKYKDSIYKIAIGIYSTISNGTERLIEMYSIQLNSNLDIKKICKNLQRMNLLRGKYVIKMKVFTTSFIEIEGFKKCGEIWNIENLKEIEIEGFKIYQNNACQNNEEVVVKDSTKDVIKCACTIDSNEKDMIQCAKCLCWVHASCHGFFSSKDKRIKKEFCCYLCTGFYNKELRDCCIYRRILGVVYNEIVEIDLRRERLKDIIQKRFILSNMFTEELVKRLFKDGFVRIGIKPGIIEIVKSKEIKEKIKEYFNGKKMECLISTVDIRCDINYC